MLIWLILAGVGNAQQISLIPVKTQASVGESVLINVVINISKDSASGVSAAIGIPTGLAIVGSPSKSWYLPLWRDVSIEPRIENNVLYLAAALKGTSAPCSGECIVARFEVTSATEASYTVPFSASKTFAMNSNKTEVPFLEFTSASIMFGKSTGLDSDGDGIPDSMEELLGLDANSSDSDDNGVADGDEDFDGDGITNAQEVAQGKNPAVFKGDVDGDKELTLDDASAIILRVFNRLTAQQVADSIADVDGDPGLTLDDATAVILRVFNRIGHLG
tara:strand:+ start:1369 stop:2196 length:828 start_codon:yes stop_codon:yes gene_type:complete